MNLNRKYQVTLKRDIIEAMQTLIMQLVQATPNDDDDKLLLAVLAKIHTRLYQKLGNVRTEYQISFEPHEAFALRLLYTGYIAEPITQLGNKMHKIACEVHKQYSI